jgi:hypothetical protein
MVFEAAGQIQFGQFDLVANDVIDPADMFAVGTDDFEVFADLTRVYHGGSCRWGTDGETAWRCVRLHTAEVGMGEIVNLNRVRKDRAKTEARATASANRAAHGRSKVERDRVETERARAARLLDGSKLED